MNKTKVAKIIGNFPKSRILVLGDVMLDCYLWGNVERISPEAPVPVVNVTTETIKLGGAANVAANVSALGTKTILMGIVGDDKEGTLFKTVLNEKGIRTSGLIVIPGRPTTVKTRIVAHNQQVVRVDKENSSELDGDLVDQIMTKIKRHIKDIDGLIISDYGKGVITYELLSELIPMANRLGVFVAVDPKEAHFMNYQNVSVITPNHHEAGFVSGKKIVNDQVLMDVGWNLLDLLNLESLLITLGEKGMALFERDRTFTFLPVEAKTVYDVTGAGDTVIATLTVAKTAGADIKEAALMSNVAAGLSVAKLGTAQISTFELEKAMSDRK